MDESDRSQLVESVAGFAFGVEWALKEETPSRSDLLQAEYEVSEAYNAIQKALSKCREPAETDHVVEEPWDTVKKVAESLEPTGSNGSTGGRNDGDD